MRPDNFEGTADDDNAIETVELGGEICSPSHGEKFHKHFSDENAEETVLSVG